MLLKTSTGYPIKSLRVHVKFPVGLYGREGIKYVTGFAKGVLYMPPPFQLFKVAKSDACIRPLFANPVTYVST